MNTLKEVFQSCTADEFHIYPPSQQFDKKLYADFKKHMTQNLGKWQSNKKRFVFEFNANNLLTKLQNGETPNFRQDWHYFPTPKKVIEFMGNICIPTGCRILEPSAGQGAIIEGINEMFPCPLNTWTIIEAHPLNQKKLQEKGFNVAHDDFETYSPDTPFDIIYANPPFKKAFEHVQKMIECTAKEGSIIVVLPSSFPSKYKKEIQGWEDMFEHIQIFPLPEGSFKESKTAVDTLILHFAYKKAI